MLKCSKAKTAATLIGSCCCHRRGLRAWHADKVEVVNVGDPNCSTGTVVLAYKRKSEEAEMVARKSDEA